MVAEPVVTLVGDDDTGFFGFDGGVGEVLRWWDVRRISNLAAWNEETDGRVSKRALGDCLEER